MKDIIYCVKPNRTVHIPVPNGQPEVWANPGEYIKVDHPMLHEWMKGQEHKVVEVAKLPTAATLTVGIPQRLIRLMAKYDRENRASGQAAANVDVDGPLKELEAKIDAIEAKNTALASENKKLQAQLKTATAKKSK